MKTSLMASGIEQHSSLQDAQSSIDENQQRFVHRMPDKWKRIGL
jgi:hypothetical protein